MPETVAGWRQRLWEARARTIAALTDLTDADLSRPWVWRDRPDDVRYALLRIADDDQEALIELQSVLAGHDWRAPEPARVLALAELSRASLIASLVGVPDQLLDAMPAPGEWPLRTVLAHLILSERRYYQRTAWHVEMTRAGQGTAGEAPDGVVDPWSEIDLCARGGMKDFLERLDTVREETLAVLADVQPADLDSPAGWASYTVTVRFRLHRVAAHEREHTGQVQSTLRAVGFAPSEVQRLLAQAHVTRGQLLAALVGVPDALLNRSTKGHRGTVSQLLQRLVDSEQQRVQSVLAAVRG